MARPEQISLVSPARRVRDAEVLLAVALRKRTLATGHLKEVYTAQVEKFRSRLAQAEKEV